MVSRHLKQRQCQTGAYAAPGKLINLKGVMFLWETKLQEPPGKRKIIPVGGVEFFLRVLTPDLQKFTITFNIFCFIIKREVFKPANLALKGILTDG